MFRSLINNIYADPTKLLFCKIFIIAAAVVTVLGFILTVIVMINTKKHKEDLEKAYEEIKEEYMSIYSDIKEEDIPRPLYLDSMEQMQEALLIYLRRGVIKFDLFMFFLIILVAI